MQKGQKSVRGGIEDFLCPFTDMYITQGSNGSYSHKGTMSNDVRGLQSGVRYPYYAPCTVKCIKITPSYGEARWQSVNKVRFSNGRIDYATFETAHDDSFNAKVGQVVPQGVQLGNMGTKAGDNKTTGVHCHIQISQSNDSTYYRNKYGILQFNNEYDTDDCYFMDGTNIMNVKSANWKYLKDVPVEEVKKEDVKEEPKEDSTTKIAELQEVINSLNEEIKKLNEQLEEQPKLIFTSPKTDYYAIKLLEERELYIK